MQIGVLGPLEVRDDDGTLVHVAGARLRALLITLALTPGRLVPTARLVDGVWGEAPPAGAANALQALVSRLRRALPGIEVVSEPAGYRLAIDPEDVDVARAERLLAAGRGQLAAGDHAAAARTLREAVAAWRGPALVDVADEDAFRGQAVRLDDVRLAATEVRAEADLRAGAAAPAVVAELATLVAENPRRERLVGLLMRALCAAGRPADALATYEATRTRLVEELGTDPSAELSALHLAVLRGEVGPTPFPGAPPSAPAAGPDAGGPGPAAAPATPPVPDAPAPLAAPAPSAAPPVPDAPAPLAAPAASAPVAAGAPGGEAEPAAAPGVGGEPPGTNLRAGLTSFVGRGGDVARVQALVGEYRLVTLTGPGGSGKTRLAVESSHGLVGRAPGGVWLVELARVTDGADVPAAVLGALGVREQAMVVAGAADDPVLGLVAALRAREALVVLDNCEHVVDAAADLVDRLLGECPQVRVLATSREPLGITGEATWPVEPLASPPAGLDGPDLASYDAVRLFVDRARAARPGFALAGDEAAAVARICRALDGMPLAIEMAAARLRTMTARQVADRLDDRFRLLTGGSRTALPRHRSLRAVVGWSWDLLPEPERALLRRLTVFTGGATAAAAARVCAGGPVAADEVADLLLALADKSLAVPDGGDEPRYRLLETVKAYARERLAEAGEAEALRRAHGAYVAELVEEAEPHLRRAEQLVWLRRLTADHDDITAAVRGAVAAGDGSLAVRIVAAAGWYWWLGGHKAEGSDLVAAALAAPYTGEPGTDPPGTDPPGTDPPATGTGPAGSDEARATAYAVAALFATAGLGDEAQALAWAAQARRWAGPSPRSPLLRFVEPLAEVLTTGAALPDAAMAPLLTDEDPWVRAEGRRSLAEIHLDAGHNTAAAEADLVTALEEFRAIGERWGLSLSHSALADLLARRGDLVAADRHYGEAVVVLAEVGTLDDTLFARARQAQLRWLVGDAAGSAAALADAESIAGRVTWPHAVASMRHATAELARWQGDGARARAELARAEEALAGIAVHPVFRAMVLDTRAHLDAADGAVEAARALRQEAFSLVDGYWDGVYSSLVIVGLADHAVAVGLPADAVRLLAAARAMRGGPDRSRPDEARIEAAARAALGERAHAATVERAAAALDGPPAERRRDALALARDAAAAVLRPLSAPAAG